MPTPNLKLDHIIIRSGQPEETLAELAERGRMPIHAPVQSVGGLLSGIVRAGPIDIEVVALGDPPAEPVGYGLGFVAPEGFEATVQALRSAGIATSPAPWVRAGGRRWRAAQIHGLLADPFPAPTSTRELGAVDRIGEVIGGVLVRIPPFSRAATRKAGSSMVVLTEYGFDVEAERALAAPGPAVAAVRVGTAGFGEAWERLRLSGVQLHLDDLESGLKEVVLVGRGEDFAIGDVAFTWRTSDQIKS